MSMQCNRAEFLEMDGGGKREKADAYERAMVSETGVKSRDVLVSSALRRLSEELACFSERSAERFGNPSAAGGSACTPTPCAGASRGWWADRTR